MHPPEATGRLGERHGHTLLGRQGRQRNHRRRRGAGPEFETVVIARRPRRGDPRGARPARTRPAWRRRLARQRSAARSAGQPHGRRRPAAPGCCHGVPGRVTRRSRRPSAARSDASTDRWDELGRWLHDWSTHGDCDVTVDAGTGEPPAGLVAHADRSLLVTRPCYLSLRRAVHAATRPTGIVLVDEPGRALSQRDVEHALGVAVEATVSLDPAVARAVDAGLLATRLPRVISRELRQVAA